MKIPEHPTRLEPPSPRGRILALGLPLVALGILTLVWTGAERSRVVLDQAEARAARLLRGLTHGASALGDGGLETLRGPFQSLAGDGSPIGSLWLVTERQVGRFVFQKARTYVAHSDPALSGRRLDQAKDKAAYDASKMVETRFDKYFSTKPDLVYLVDWSDDRTRISAAGPVVVGGKLAGAIGFDMEVQRPEVPLPWLGVLLLLLTGIAAGALALRFLPGLWPQAVAFTLITLGLGYGAYRIEARVLERCDSYATARTVADLVALHGALPKGVDRAGLARAFARAGGPGRKPTLVEGEPSTAPKALLALSPEALPKEPRVAGASVSLTREPGITPYLDGLRASVSWTTLVALVFVLLGLGGYLVRFGRMVREHAVAYGYAAPAMIGMALFVFFPFVSGFVFSFFQHVTGDDLTGTVTMFGMHFRFVGLQNFFDILGSREYSFTDGRNFYFTLLVTILWTVSNVALHVGIGLALALVLKNPWVKLKGLYRVLLIVPWAVPNYITALIWRGMFDVEFGSVNYVLELLGIGRVAWWSHFWSAFTANLVTNVWLGFPFMMVISLGALQSIPADLYEAARVDGATRWQQFRHITLPLLKPALFPAVILGTIWTFNMFNIIYLVSGGAPEHTTDILITDAYRFAFEGGRRYGYAAAYSVIIFLILLVYGTITNRMTKASEGAFD